MTQKEQEKIDRLVKGNHRKPDEPIDMDRLIEIAEKSNKLEEESKKQLALQQCGCQ